MVIQNYYFNWIVIQNYYLIGINSYSKLLVKLNNSVWKLLKMLKVLLWCSTVLLVLYNIEWGLRIHISYTRYYVLYIKYITENEI